MSVRPWSAIKLDDYQRRMRRARQREVLIRLAFLASGAALCWAFSWWRSL